MDEHEEARVLLICEAPDLSKALIERLTNAGFASTTVSFDGAIPRQDPPQVILVAITENSPTDLEQLGYWVEAHPDLDAIACIDTGSPAVGLRALAAGASSWIPAELSQTDLRRILDLARAKQEQRSRLAADRRRIWNLLEQAPIGVFELTDGRVSFINDYMLKRLGYELDELVGQRPDELDLLTPLERPLMRRAIEERHRGIEAEEPNIYHFAARDGTTYVGEVFSRIVQTPDGPRMEGTVRDITLETRLTKLQRIVLKLGEVILAEESIDRSLQLVLDAITEYGGFHRAVLSLFDLSIPAPFEGETRKTLTSGLSEGEREALRSQPPMSLAERRLAFSEEFPLGPAYYVPHDRTPWGAEVGISGTVAVDGWHKDDYLFIPLSGSEGIIGSISVDDPIDTSAPTLASIEPVASLANIAALAVERTYKLAQVRRQKEHLRGLSAFGRELLQASGVRVLCEIAAERINEDLDYQACAIWLRDGSKIVKEAGGARGEFAAEEILEEGSHAYVDGPGLTRWVLQHGESVIIPNTLEDDRYNGSRETIRSFIAVPIRGRKGTLGVINAASQRIAAFGEQDLEVLTALAGQLSTAISGQRRREALSRIYSLGQRLASASDQEQILTTTLDVLVEQFEYQFCAILLNEDVRQLTVVGVRGSYTESGIGVGWSTDIGSGLVGWAAEIKHHAIVDDVTSDSRYFKAFTGTRSELVVPVLSSGEPLGVINVESPQVGFFDEEDRQILEVVANHLAIALSNLSSQADLREQAIRDPLTGLYNRHYFNSIIGSEIGRSDRYDRPLALMMIDIDGFRAVNNQLGHLKGDDVLREVARMLERNVRTADRVIRYGGDEFLVFMPETDGHGASEIVADRLREEIATIPPRTGIGHLRLGLSIGIYTRMPKEDRTLESILEEVDRRMYADKRGKNGNGEDAPRD